jgi:hypothetical protein
MRHETIVWNPAIQEWFCTKCGQPLQPDASVLAGGVATLLIALAPAAA